MGSPCDPVDTTQTLPGSMCRCPPHRRPRRGGRGGRAGEPAPRSSPWTGRVWPPSGRRAEGGVDDLLHPVDVAGEAGHDDPPAGRASKRRRSVAPTVVSDSVKPGSSALVESDSSNRIPGSRRQGPDPGQVGEPTVDRGEVDLEVPRVQDHPLGRVKGGGEPVGHRVGDGDELDLEGSDLASLPVDHLDELGPVGQAGLLDPVAGQPEGERGAVDGHRQVPEEKARPPVWSSWPWVRTTASTASAFSRRYDRSGRTRSMPGMSGSGNMIPQSSTTIRPSSSMHAQFRPISPSPPRKMTRTDDPPPLPA